MKRFVYTFLVLLVVFCIRCKIRFQLTTDVGNIIDFSTRLYLFSRCNLKLFKILKFMFLSESTFPDKIYYPEIKIDDTIHNSYYRINNFLWESSDENKIYIRNYTRYVINKLFEYNLKTYPILDKDCICIHIRCSDIPFVKHTNYHLYKMQWYKNAIDFALTLGTYSKIVIVSCSGHKSTNEYKDACKLFVDSYYEFLSSTYDFPVSIVCQTMYEDMYTMYNSKCLIASPSSFSYYVGISSDNIFITTSTKPLQECNDSYSNTHCSDIPIKNNMYYIPPLYIDHKNVDCYVTQKYDVVRMLNE